MFHKTRLDADLIKSVEKLLDEQPKVPVTSKQQTKQALQETKTPLQSIHEEIAESLVRRLNSIHVNEGDEAALEAYNALTEEEQGILKEYGNSKKESLNEFLGKLWQAAQDIAGSLGAKPSATSTPQKTSSGDSPGEINRQRSRVGPGGPVNTPLSNKQMGVTNNLGVRTPPKAAATASTAGSLGAKSPETPKDPLGPTSAPRERPAGSQRFSISAQRAVDAAQSRRETQSRGLANPLSPPEKSSAAPATSSVTTTKDTESSVATPAASSASAAPTPKPAAPATSSAPKVQPKSSETSRPAPKPKAERPISGSEGGSFAGQPSWARKAFGTDSGG